MLYFNYFTNPCQPDKGRISAIIEQPKTVWQIIKEQKVDFTMPIFINPVSELEQSPNGDKGSDKDDDNPNANDAEGIRIDRSTESFDFINERSRIVFARVEFALSGRYALDYSHDTSGEEDEILETAEQCRTEFDGQRPPCRDERFFSLTELIFVIVNGVLEHDENDHVDHASTEKE